MKYERLEPAVFLSRPNRFIAEVMTEEKNDPPIRVHVKNTGRLRELLPLGAAVWLQKAENPARKTPYDLIAVEHEGEMVSIDSQMPNDLVEEWLPKSGLFSERLLIHREVRYGESRFDFYLQDGERQIFLEVKGVTLRRNGEAFFPDAPTERGVRHMEELIKCRREGLEAMLLFVVQRKGVSCVRPNEETHPAFAETLRKAEQEGVRLLACDCLVNPEEIRIDRMIPVRTGNTEERENDCYSI